MPGLVVFRRRWSVGSDDLIVPGAFLLTIHLIWLIVLSISVLVFEYDTSQLSIKLLWYFKLGYLGILIVSISVELAICIISMRGSILDTSARKTMNYWLYAKSFVILFDISWLVLGSMWLRRYYFEAPIVQPKEIALGVIICNWLLMLTILITIWCSFDAAGRSWVKMKKYQRSMRESESRFNYKRSGSMNRNWRQRKVIRAYQDSWDHRCRLLFCCMGASDRNRNSFADIARLLSDFFRELDVVPSDVVAGLVLLRKFQKLEREAIVRQRKNGTYEFLSGVPITERTQFLALNDAKDYDFFQTVIHYMHFAHGAYGWPMYFIMNRTKACNLCAELRCCFSCCRRKITAEVIKDNCCQCNYAALKKTLEIGDIEITYVTFHVDIGETPFYVAIDYTEMKVVVSIRGTLSMKDVLTDLNAESEVLPLDPPREDWLGHKGMVQAAIYIKNKLEEENLIQKALAHNPARNTHNFGLVLVGHSLGAGTASILAILLKPQYPSLQCFSYSPPGGLLSMPAVEYSKSFITSIVVGKDVVPRIGLHQMEAFRGDLINAIKQSIDPKWQTIACSVICCGCASQPTSVIEMSSGDTHINLYKEQRKTARGTSAHPTDSSIALTFHQPLYPPGRIIHVVRHHPKPDEQVLKNHEPVYQAIWAETTDFDEVIISPVMLQDHMPDKVLSALKKVVTTVGPKKPQRQSSAAIYNPFPNDILLETASIQHHQMCNHNNRAQSPISNITNSLSTPNAAHKLCLETSFTNLQSPQENLPSLPLTLGGQNSSKTSSMTGSLLFGRSQMSSSIQQYDISSLGADDPFLMCRSPSGPSEATTVILAAEGGGLQNFPSFEQHRTRNISFDMASGQSNASGSTSSAYRSLSPIPLIQPASAKLSSTANNDNDTPVNNHNGKQPFHRQLSSSYKKPSKRLPIDDTFNRRASDINRNPIDLIHDDWFGLAPLASPETLSEISSISSRASAALSLANSIERYLQKVSINENGNQQLMDEIYESQMHTPKVMRRAPKITENLSTCADDWRSVDQYKRMGQVFVTSPLVPFDYSNSSSNSSEQMFGSALSLTQQTSKRILPYPGSGSTDNRIEGGGGKVSEGSGTDRIRDDRSEQKLNILDEYDGKFALTSDQQRNKISENSKSADNIDNDSFETIKSSTGSDYSTNKKKLTFSDSAILGGNEKEGEPSIGPLKRGSDIIQCTSSCPNCPCRNASMGYSHEECCHKADHTFCSLVASPRTNTSSTDTYFSAMSSLEQFSTPLNHPILCKRQQQQQMSSSPGNNLMDLDLNSSSSINSNNNYYNNSNINYQISEETITIPPTIVHIHQSGILESHFPVFSTENLDTSDRTSLIPDSPKNQASAASSSSSSRSPTITITTNGGNKTSKIVINSSKGSSSNSASSGGGGGNKQNTGTTKSSNSHQSQYQSPSMLVVQKQRSSLLKKRNSNEERIFSRNESLPLLAHLSVQEKSSSPSPTHSSPPSFVKRKNYVYPMTTMAPTSASIVDPSESTSLSGTNMSNPKSESSV